ncbi:MAG: FkbM family methyltransferase [Burkholderiaceae bacterium]
MSSNHSWIAQAAALSPLIAHGQPGKGGGEDQIIAKVFEHLPAHAGFGVEFGQPVIGTGTLAAYMRQRQWGGLYMDPRAVSLLDARHLPNGRVLTLARETVTPANINALFERHSVPHDLDALVIDIDGFDYHAWDALDARYQPSLVIIEFNAHVGAELAASIALDERWHYGRNRDYGASLAAMCSLAERKGYRLIHVHGPWNLYFIRQDQPFPQELTVRWPLSSKELSMLTDVEGFYDSMCQPGDRPSWFETPAPDVACPPWEILPPDFASQTIDLEGLALDVLANKADAQWYLQRKAFEEKASALYRFLGREGFANFVDVGANVGFVSILAYHAVPGLKVLAVEADPRLASLVRRNFRRHGLNDGVVVNAVVGAKDEATTGFSLNPSSTLDNRVLSSRWQQVQVPMRRLDHLVQRYLSAGRTFYKIDTQGFELQVLRGLEPALKSSAGWLLKMEFAPDWLRSQGTEPMTLLDHLQTRYEFCEFPERIPFGTKGIDSLFGHVVGLCEHEAFLSHVSSLNRNGRGWVDLLVRPRSGLT